MTTINEQLKQIESKIIKIKFPDYSDEDIQFCLDHSDDRPEYIIRLEDVLKALSCKKTIGLSLVDDLLLFDDYSNMYYSLPYQTCWALGTPLSKQSSKLIQFLFNNL